MFVVAYGSPLGGFKLHGSFPTADAAADWGEAMGEGGEWVMEIHPPRDDGQGLYPSDSLDLMAAARALVDEAKDWQSALGEGDRPSLDQAISNIERMIAPHEEIAS
jgi:hypothetical protein